MSDLIDRQAALDVLCDACGNCACPKGKIPRCSYYEKMQAIPAASPWHRVEEELPSEFQDVWAACKMNGRENWTIETMYDPYLSCPWGHIPVLESGKAIVYAWMDRSAPEPPKEDEK